MTPGQKVFGRYTLVRILGRGGMGVVWLAKDDKLDREVALKFLPEVMMGDKLALTELKRETRRSLELTHSHIVRIYDFMEDARTAAIAMEYIAGDTLTNARVGRPGHRYEPTELAAWVTQLCSALDYAHTKAKVVHRDLKPANLMIDAAGDLKVTDFGIASSIADSVSRVSREAGSSGTPVYMSPQQMMGEKPSVADDVYSLGATLYDLLTGKPPFYTGNIILQVQNKMPPSIAERRQQLEVAGASISAEWEQTIASCLAKEPKDRPTSAREVAERLGLAQWSTQNPATRTPQPEPAITPAPPPRATSAGAKSKAPLFVGIAAGVVMMAAAGYYFGIYAPEQRRLAEIARLEADGRAAEAAQLRNQQEREAALAREQAEREQRDFAIIRARIDSVLDGAPRNQLEAAQKAVNDYLAKAPDRYRVDIITAWTPRSAAWETSRLASARGGIAIRTNPEGAEVRVGAVALDRSPLNLRDQRLGKYPVRVRLEGYEAWDGEIEVRENEFAELNLTLVRSTGRVVLRGTPGAEVYRGQQRLGVLPLTLDEVPTGDVRYTVSANGYTPQVLNGVVPRQQELVLSAELETIPFPSAGQPFENTLGMRFVPVPGLNVLFSVWETRVKDFQDFVNATGHDATKGMWSIAGGAWKQQGHTWANPGFAQSPSHPVVGINWDDAKAFCRWLTDKERREGKLAPNQEYRLPTDAEWTAATAGDQYPWGNQWPPPPNAGNYVGNEPKDANWPSNWVAIAGYNDGYAMTAPVGTYRPNRFGLYDLGGNAKEQIEDRKKGMRGAGFNTYNQAELASSYPESHEGERGFNVGFRVVCVLGR